jgi:hypothetical protein
MAMLNLTECSIKLGALRSLTAAITLHGILFLSWYRSDSTHPDAHNGLFE